MTQSRNPDSEIRLDPSQAASGGVFPLLLTTPAPCQSCSGSGFRPDGITTVCPGCNGQMALQIECIATSADDDEDTSGFCMVCRGNGWFSEHDCDDCNGSGLTAMTRTIKIRIPAGVHDGQQIRLPGQGFVSAREGAVASNLYVAVKVSLSPPPNNETDADCEDLAGKEAKLQKVAKLLRQAEDRAGTPEAAVFQDRAFALMAKYGLHEAMVRAALHEDAAPHEAAQSDAVEYIFDITSRYGSHHILGGLGRALHCRLVLLSDQKAGCPRARVQIFAYGMPDHIERVKFLWDLLEPQALRALDLLPEGDSWDSPHSVYRRSWVVGFAVGIESRLSDQEQKTVESAGNGAAVVLYKNDEQRADTARSAKWPALRPAERINEDWDYSAYADGHRAGRSAALNRSVSAASSQSLACA